jgi:endonuclease G
MQVGYNPDFIGEGIRVPLPTFNRSLGQSVLRKSELRDDQYSDHPHFTLVMNEHTRQLIYSAYNIDQTLFRPSVSGKGKRSWRNDATIGSANQLDNRYYADRTSASGHKIPNPYDRGHMVMRFNNMWGTSNQESDTAGKATFIYANSSLQHENLNRDEWKAIELDIVRNFQDDSNDKLSVFTGPIFGDLDRHINLSDEDSPRVPSGFFKVICFQTKDIESADNLGVLAFAVFQDDEVLRDKKGGKAIKTNTRYQVTISEIQQWTGINFGKQLYERNPLFFHDRADRNTALHVGSVPERIPVIGEESIIGSADEKRSEVEHLALRKILINSAMINPGGHEKRGEWISLHNRGNRKISIKDWTLVDGQGRKATLSGSIGSGESIRLKGPGKGKILLSNAGGSLTLYDKHGCLIDHATWSASQVRRMAEDVALVFDNSN